MLTYHGTSARCLPSIWREGIKPRGKLTGNWKHSIESNSKAVYLTTAYPLYFAQNALRPGETRIVIFEIDTDRLNPWNMGADEDAVEQYLRHHPAQDPIADKGWDMKRRTRWFRRRVHEYSWEASVELLGTCCHIGTVPPRAFTRYAVVDIAKATKLAWIAADPTITILNYKLVGAKYRSLTRWVFGDPPLPGDEPDLWPRHPDWPLNMGPIVVKDGQEFIPSWVLPPGEERAAITVHEMATA